MYPRARKAPSRKAVHAHVPAASLPAAKRGATPVSSDGRVDKQDVVQPGSGGPATVLTAGGPRHGLQRGRTVKTLLREVSPAPRTSAVPGGLAFSDTEGRWWGRKGGALPLPGTVAEGGSPGGGRSRGCTTL